MRRNRIATSVGNLAFKWANDTLPLTALIATCVRISALQRASRLAGEGYQNPGDVTDASFCAALARRAARVTTALRHTGKLFHQPQRLYQNSECQGGTFQCRGSG